VHLNPETPFELVDKPCYTAASENYVENSTIIKRYSNKHDVSR